MKLRVNTVEVFLQYLEFVDKGAGTILQLLIPSSEKGMLLHGVLATAFQDWYPPGTMTQSDVKDGHIEIRLLNATNLNAIDLMRMLGHGVEEVLPNV